MTYKDMTPRNDQVIDIICNTKTLKYLIMVMV